MSSDSAPKTILLRGNPQSSEGPAKVGSNLLPGMLIDTHTDGTIKPHATFGGYAAKRFARENDVVGKGIDDVYADTANVLMWDCKSGDWIYALLAAGETVAIGALLQSNGNGYLGDVPSVGKPVARALEAVNNSPGSGGLPVRIKVEVL